MKKLFILFVCLILISCTQTVPVSTITVLPATQKAVNVLDSLWNIVPDTKLSRSIIAARSVGDLATVQTAVEKYNASNIDDQWFLYIGEYPNLENAPPCTIYIVDKVTHEVVTYSDGVGGFITLKETNWPRKQLVENIQGWKLDAVHANADLYIDVIPPAPVIVIPTDEQLYAMRSIYVVNSIGEIKFEEHCTETFIQENWPNNTLEQYYNIRVGCFNSELSNPSDEHTPWRVIAGQLYTEGAL